MRPGRVARPTWDVSSVRQATTAHDVSLVEYEVVEGMLMALQESFVLIFIYGHMTSVYTCGHIHTHPLSHNQLHNDKNKHTRSLHTQIENERDRQGDTEKEGEGASERESERERVVYVYLLEIFVHE